MAIYCVMSSWWKAFAVFVLYLFVDIVSAHDLIEKAQILGYPQITCSPKWITVWFETSVPFQGRIFVEDHPYDTRCSTTYVSNLEANATFRFPIVPCASPLNHTLGTYASAKVRVTFHPYMITNNSRIIKVECQEFSESNDEVPNKKEENSICHHLVMRKKTNLKAYLTIGETIYHRWTCSPKYDVENYAVFLRNCDVTSPMKETVHLVDENGCIIDEYLFDDLEYSNNSLSIAAISRAYKFIDQEELRFSCHVVLIKRRHKNEPLNFPKCSISRNELENHEPFGTTYLDFFTTFNDTQMIETKTVTEWITVRDDPKVLETLEQTDMKLSAKVNVSINEAHLELEKLMKQDSIGEFYPNSASSKKAYIPTMEEMMARMHAQKEVGRAAIHLEELTPLLDQENASDFELTSVNNSKNEELQPTVEDDFEKVANLPPMEYFEVDEGSLENMELGTESPKENETEVGITASSYHADSKESFLKNIIESIKTTTENDKSTEIKKEEKIKSTTISSATQEPQSMSTKLFKSLMDGFIANNQVIQSDEIDLTKFNSFNKTPKSKPINNHLEFNLDSDPTSNPAMSDCNNKVDRLGPEETSSHYFCSWRQVNLVLFTFSMVSVIIWMIMLGVKIMRCFWVNAELSRSRHRIHTTWGPSDDFNSYSGWYSRVGTPKPPRYDQG